MENFAMNHLKDSLIIACILKSLRAIPDKDREIFVRKHYQGQEEHCIAEKLGLSVEQVRESLDRSSMLLFHNLRPYAGPIPVEE